MSRNRVDQDPLQQTYDVVVVGSGATGGWAAKQLAEAGLKVALLEAGRGVSPKEFTEHVPAYIVFSDAVLRAMAASLPATERELLAISGVGPVKLERYGDRFLELLRASR